MAPALVGNEIGSSKLLPGPKLTGRRWFFSFLKQKQSLKELETLSIQNPNNVEFQNNYLTELNKKNPEEVLRKLEDENFSKTLDPTIKRNQYIKALVAMNKFDSLNVMQSSIAPIGVTTNFQGNGNNYQQHSNAHQGNAFYGASHEPLKVIIQPTSSDKLWRGISLALGLLVPAAILTLGYFYLTEEKNGTIPVAPAHSMISDIDVKFDDVKGIDEAKEDLKEVVEYLRNPKKFTALGAKLPKGVLLFGEPGSGKTLLARAVAGEAGVPFLYVSGSAFDEMFVGVGPRRVRDLFEDAKKMSPCIIFIDEIDAVGVSRKYNMSGGSYAKESTLNQLLTEMDGFKQNDGIIVIGATNLPDALDPALTRPGRFDKMVVVPSPDINGRKQIIDLYLKKTKHDVTIDSQTLARGTVGFTGAELSNLINIACIKAAVAGKPFVDMRTLEEARDDLIMGGKKRTVAKTKEELLLTAYHEAGHALVAMYTEGAQPVHKATIAHRGNALGVTSFLPEKDEYSITRKSMHASILVSLGGRAAEHIVFGDDGITTGASSDFMKATSLARNMIMKLGFSDAVGPVYHGADNSYKISEQEQHLIDSEVKQLLQKSYDRSMGVLKEHEDELHRLAHALLKYETLSIDDMKNVVKGQPLRKW